jgi:hypothetical protein
MKVGIWARKTVALGLAATLVGPGVSLLSAQEGQNQEEKRARRQEKQEQQQRKQAERQQQQAERRAQRETQGARQQERAQQDQQARQREREERAQRQNQRQADEQRARQEQRQANEQRRGQQERAQQDQQARQREREERVQRQQERQAAEQRARQEQREQSQRQQAEQAQRRQQTDQAQRDLERRQRRNDQGRAEAEARAAESARQAQRESGQREAQRIEAERSQRGRDDARYRQPRPGQNDGRDYRRDGRRGGRVITEAQRGDIIRENRERSESWGRGWSQRERRGLQRTRELQQQRRYAFYRYQQRYLERQRNYWRNDDWRRYDYYGDPYFSVAPDYRYRYQGRYYQVNDYGADLLREAVNHGYEEGFYAGQADREDRWHGDYRDSYVYEDASYGYRGLYVDQEQYSYYFRQGFDRGYADGYNGRHEYGRRDNTGLKILAGVLAGILVFEALD